MGIGTKHARRGVRWAGLAGAVSIAAVATAVISAAPAGATAPALVGASLDTGSAADFSYTASGQQLARNVSVSVAWSVTNDTLKSVSWQDLTANGPSEAAATTVPQVLPEGVDFTITDIPLSTCGHTLQINVSGAGEPTGTTTLVETCGPELVATGEPSEFTNWTSFFGDGLAPGITYKAVAQSSTGAAIWSGSVTSTTEIGIPSCHFFDGKSVCGADQILQAPGQVNITVPTGIGCWGELFLEQGFPVILPTGVRTLWLVVAESTHDCLT